MTDVVKDQLSACLDGELAAEELDLLLKRMERDPEARDALGRYALIGEALRSPHATAAPKDFASRVMAAVEAEAVESPARAPAIATARPGERRPATHRPAAANAAAWVGRLRPVVGMAIAAGVAAIAIISVQQPGAPAGQPLAAVQGDAPAAEIGAAAEPSYVVPSTTSNTAFVPATRLTNYVVAHSEFSSPLGRRSMLSGMLAEDDTAIVEVTDETGAEQGATPESASSQDESQEP